MDDSTIRTCGNEKNRQMHAKPIREHEKNCRIHYYAQDILLSNEVAKELKHV